jgi:hypothetical protein
MAPMYGQVVCGPPGSGKVSTKAKQSDAVVSLVVCIVSDD